MLIKKRSFKGINLLNDLFLFWNTNIKIQALKAQTEY